ncbi:hypothetical protein H7F10_04500 [Acidithiobacillus sp. HP-6]|uniref:hypothetical protein n=1 Tax=unclassified Acidithiobacillus TaxID=2614800 RepID=UPI001879F930|nr:MULTISPECIES: hypothetical protein [unclassified Acidithiobacillus]MBE7562231.1 hypothetical protein [Acidithiobacillus sp. HP-6]MBE7568956.1 hypothetical protein [Acidithiobacillus sp. HP-2]
MKKATAVKMFGTASRLAKVIGISKACMSAWPDVLTPRQSNEVIGAALRMGIPIQDISKAMDEPEAIYKNYKLRTVRESMESLTG